MKTEPENIYEIEGDDSITGVKVGETFIPQDYRLLNSPPSDFSFQVINNSLNIKNKSINKEVYIKIGKKDNQKLLFSSDTGLNGSFSRINFKEKSGFPKILKELQLNLDINNDKLLTIFGSEKKEKIYDYLTSPGTGLNPIDPSDIGKRATFGKIYYGYGLNKIPETAQFGKNIILLKKLYYNNILSIKDRNLHNIEGLKNVPVSDNLVKIIMDIVTKQKPSIYNINKLKSDEKELYNIYII